MKNWIVLWHHNQRLGSIENTDKHMTDLHKQFSMSLIQQDATGTIHYEILEVMI